MRVSLFIALRFLFCSAKTRQIGVFAAVSILGIAGSVLIFLLIDSIINGLTSHLRTALIGFEAPLTLEVSGDLWSQVPEHIKEFQKKHPEFQLKTVPMKQFDGFLQVPGQTSMGAKVRSVGKDFLTIKENDLEVYWLEGFDKEQFAKDENLILVGEKLFGHLNFMPGNDEMVLVTHPFADIGPAGDIEPAEKLFFVAGIFHAKRTVFDEGFVFVSDVGMQGLASDPVLEKSIYLFPAKQKLADQIKKLWSQDFSLKGTQLRTWYDKNENLFKAMQLEKLMYLVVFIFVLTISCFNLAALVSLFGVSKAEDAAVLRTIGLSYKKIRRIYVNVGLFLGIIGAVLGLSLGLVIIFVAQKSGFSLPEAYGFTELPLSINVKTVLLLLFGTPLFTALISYLPASRVTAKTVMEAIRLS